MIMFSVFSNSKLKPSEQIEELHSWAGSNALRLLIAGPEDEPLYMLKPSVLPWLIWINNKILFELPKVKTANNSAWIWVRIRIATSMLNNLEKNGILDKDVCILYHERLTSNVRQILNEIQVEDLPF